MSIIEQALNKLEHARPVGPEDLPPDEFYLPINKPNTPARLSTRLLIVLFGVFGIIAFFTIQIGEGIKPSESPNSVSDDMELLKTIKENTELLKNSNTNGDQQGKELESILRSPKSNEIRERPSIQKDKTDLHSKNKDSMAQTRDAPENVDSLTTSAAGNPENSASLTSGNSQNSETNSYTSWIDIGWQWVENGSSQDALRVWENGFVELEEDTRLFIANITPFSKRTAQDTITSTDYKDSFFVRWPIKKGNELIELCIQTARTDNQHCSRRLSRSSKRIHKQDLAMELYAASNNKNRKLTNSDRNPRITTQKEKQKKQPETNTNRNTFDLETIVPQQLRLGNYQNVINILDKHKLKLANSWEHYYWQSQAYIGLGQLEEAEKSVTIGLTKNPEHALLWTQKGLLLQEKGDHQGAVDIFRKAEMMQNKPASLYLNMGYSAAVLGDFMLAQRAYHQYLSITEGQPEFDPSIRQQVKDYLSQIE